MNHSFSHTPERSILIAAVITLCLLPLITFAQGIPNPLGEGTTISTIIQRLVSFAQSLLAPLSVIAVLLAGLFYMTSGGNPEKLKRAHRTLVWAVIGIAIVLLAATAESIIRTSLGA